MTVSLRIVPIMALPREFSKRKYTPSLGTTDRVELNTPFGGSHERQHDA